MNTHITVDQALIASGIECVEEHRLHIAPNGAACYRSLQEADLASRGIMSDAGMDTRQIDRAYYRTRNCP